MLLFYSCDYSVQGSKEDSYDIKENKIANS